MSIRNLIAILFCSSLTLLTGCERPSDPETPAPANNGGAAAPATQPAADDQSSAVETPKTTGASLVTLNYKVEGMTCQGCVDSVTRTIAAVPGVNSCQVSLSDGSAVVHAKDGAAGEQILAAMQETGFKVTPLAQQ